MAFLIGYFIIFLLIYLACLALVKFFNNISWQEAELKLNRAITDFFKSPPAPIVHDIPISQYDMQEIAKLFKKYFQTCLFKDSFPNNNGATIYHFEIHYIAPKFLSNLEILKKILIAEINSYLLATCNFQMTEIIVLKLIEGELVIAIGTSQRGREYMQNWKRTVATKKSLPAKPDIEEMNAGNTKKHLIGLGYDFNIWYGNSVRLPISLDIATFPHLLLTGASGSGKSYALLYYLWQLSKAYIDFWMLDFKNSSDFSFLSPCGNFYVDVDCILAIEKFYDEFQTAKRNNAVRSYPILLICDEFPAMILYLEGLDKKKATELKNKVAEILMLGRSLGYGIWLTTQRPDANFFSNGSRDNFMTCIALGRISPQAKAMLFPGEDIPERPYYRKGEGLVLSDGMPLCEIKIPKITDIDRLKDEIVSAISLSNGRIVL